MWSTVGTGAGSATQQGEGVRWALDDDSGERRAKGRGERPGQRKGDEARLPSTPSVAGRATQVRRRPTSVGAGRVAHLLDDWDSHSSCPRLSIPSCTPPPLPPAPHARAHDRAHTHAAAPCRPSGRTPHQPPPMSLWGGVGPTWSHGARQAQWGVAGRATAAPTGGTHTRTPHHDPPLSSTPPTSYTRAHHSGEPGLALPHCARSRHCSQWLGNPVIHREGGRVAAVPTGVEPRHRGALLPQIPSLVGGGQRKEGAGAESPPEDAVGRRQCRMYT